MVQGRVGFLLSGPSFQDPLPPPKPVSTKLYSPFLVAKGSSILGPRGPPLGETLASRWRREGGGKTAYPWLARINPYKLTKKRGYQLARSRGEPSSRGLPWFTMLKQKATHLAAHTSGHTHTHLHGPRQACSTKHVCTRSFSTFRAKLFGTLCSYESIREIYLIREIILIFSTWKIFFLRYQSVEA